jgi:hypothetical protein
MTLPALSLPAELLAKLRAAEGEGLSRDPKNKPRKTIKLLTDKDDELKPGSKWYREDARAGQYLIGDRPCDDFIWTPIRYLDAYVEWKVEGGGYVDTHYLLPDDAEWDAAARCWFRANGNSVERGADIVGLVSHEVYWLSFRGAAITVARNFNSAASDLTVNDVLLPFFGANWRMGSVEKRSSRGKSYRQITYEHVANVGKPGGPTWDEFDRCQALCRILTKSITPATVAGVEAMAESDPRDHAVWSANHNVWTKLVSAELDRRRGQAPQWYVKLMDELTDYSLGTRSSYTASPPFWDNPPESEAPPPTEDDIMPY